MAKNMFILITCTFVYSFIASYQFYQAGIIFQNYKNRKPRKSPYRVGKRGNLYKDEYNQRFKVTFSDEFWR